MLNTVLFLSVGLVIFSRM